MNFSHQGIIDDLTSGRIKNQYMQAFLPGLIQGMRSHAGSRIPLTCQIRHIDLAGQNL